MWQNYWERLVVYPSKTYTIPKGAIGKRFIKELAQLLKDIIGRVHSIPDGQWVSGVNCFRDIKRTIE
jgi:hypothetical protein